MKPRASGSDTPCFRMSQVSLLGRLLSGETRPRGWLPSAFPQSPGAHPDGHGSCRRAPGTAARGELPPASPAS